MHGMTLQAVEFAADDGVLESCVQMWDSTFGQ